MFGDTDTRRGKERQKKKALVGVGTTRAQSVSAATATGDLKKPLCLIGGNTQYRARSPHPVLSRLREPPLIRATASKSRSTNAFVSLTRSAGNKYLDETVNQKS
jgi:hypothetical protein